MFKKTRALRLVITLPDTSTPDSLDLLSETPHFFPSNLLLWGNQTGSLLNILLPVQCHLAGWRWFDLLPLKPSILILILSFLIHRVWGAQRVCLIVKSTFFHKLQLSAAAAVAGGVPVCSPRTPLFTQSIFTGPCWIPKSGHFNSLMSDRGSKQRRREQEQEVGGDEVSLPRRTLLLITANDCYAPETWFYMQLSPSGAFKVGSHKVPHIQY